MNCLLAYFMPSHRGTRRTRGSHDSEDLGRGNGDRALRFLDNFLFTVGIPYWIGIGIGIGFELRQRQRHPALVGRLL